MKSKKETTKTKSISSNSICRLSMNKSNIRNINPSLKHKQMRKIKGKNTKSSRNEFKTENPYLRLEEFEQKICNNGDWRWEHGVFGREIV